MKRILLITMLCVYTVISVGIQIHLHYCCGKLSDFHFFPTTTCDHSSGEDNDHCCKKNNCCSFLHIDLGIDDSHQPSESSRLLTCEVSQTHIPCYEQTHAPILIHRFHKPDSSAPPNYPRYLLFRSLVYYA